MKKHAYLIIAHKNKQQMKLLLSMLDDDRNDIYLLIDKNSKELSIDDFTGVCKKSNLICIKDQTVSWGGYSLVRATYTLLKVANQKMRYSYYHLLSGQDLPLHSQDYIHKFFDENEGKEFLTFVSEAIYKKHKPSDRVKYYYPIMDFRPGEIKKLLLKMQQKIFLPLQKSLGWNRIKNFSDDIGYGSQWFSITDQFAAFVLEKQDYVESLCRYGCCVDEIFLHTLLLNSKFKENLYISKGVNDQREDWQGNLRYINWWDGQPKIWTKHDRNELMEAKERGYLFTRKFDWKMDKEVIEFVCELVQSEYSCAVK